MAHQTAKTHSVRCRYCHADDKSARIMTTSRRDGAQALATSSCLGANVTQVHRQQAMISAERMTRFSRCSLPTKPGRLRSLTNDRKQLSSDGRWRAKSRLSNISHRHNLADATRNETGFRDKLCCWGEHQQPAHATISLTPIKRDCPIPWRTFAYWKALAENFC